MLPGLWVHPHPTEEHRAYLVLSLDVSRVAADAGPELLRPTFLDAVRGRVAAFLLRHRDSSPPLGDGYARLDHFQDAEGLIGTALDVVSTTPYEVYLLIDEHDHFANRLLAEGSADLHEAAVENTGFLRAFYAIREAGTSSGAVARMFITGVCPPDARGSLEGLQHRPPRLARPGHRLRPRQALHHLRLESFALLGHV